MLFYFNCTQVLSHESTMLLTCDIETEIVDREYLQWSVM